MRDGSEDHNRLLVLRRLVEEMRHDQKEYFRSQSRSALEVSLRSERAVDRALVRLKSLEDQGDLFGSGGAKPGPMAGR